jgi:hypothetical protein
LALAVATTAWGGERERSHDGAVAVGAFAPLPRATSSAADRLRFAARIPISPEVLEAGHEEALRHALQTPAPKVGEGPDGGLAVAHHAGARPVPSPPYQLPSGIQRSVGAPAFEPSIGVTKNGNIFFLALLPSNGLSNAQIRRSTDDGRTWKALSRGLPDGGWPTEDPLIYVDPATDRLFDFELTLPCSAVFISDDHGDTFSTNLACNHADHQTLFAGPPPAGGAKPSGYRNVVYYCAIDGGASVAGLGMTACSKSLNGGRSWQRTLLPAYLSDGSRGGGSLGIPGFCYGATGHGRVGPDGTVYLPRGFCDQPFLAISHDEGDTWERVQASDLGMQTGASAGIGIEEHEARVAIDPAGNVYYFWVALDRLPYLAISRDGGKHFGRPMMVAPPGVNEAWGPALDAGATGRIAFSYLATTHSPGPPFCTRTTLTSCTTADGSPGKPDSAYADVDWSGYIGETVDALADDPVFYTAPVNDLSDPYTRGVCGAIQCEPTHEFHGLSIRSDGTAWASFSDGCTAKPTEGCDGSVGVVGSLVGGPPLIGTRAEQVPRVAARRACVARTRPLHITVRRPRRAQLRSVRVTVNGRAVRAKRHGTSFVATVNLRRYKAGRRLTVRIVSRTSAGRRYVKVRRYSVCR